MGMGVCRLLTVVGMDFSMDRDGNKRDLAVQYAALGNDVPGNVMQQSCLPSEYCNLQAACMIEMHVQRRYMQVVMVMLRDGQPLRQITGVMIEYIADHANTLGVARLWQQLLQACACEVA